MSLCDPFVKVQILDCMFPMAVDVYKFEPIRKTFAFINKEKYSQKRRQNNSHPVEEKHLTIYFRISRVGLSTKTDVRRHGEASRSSNLYCANFYKTMLM